MNTRRSISILMVVTLALFAGACSNDEKDATSKKDDKTETTKAGDKGETSTTAKPLSEKEYSTQLDKVSEAVDAAGTDTCKLVEALNTSPPEPQTKEQVKKMVDTYGQLLNAVAGALPAASADNIKALQDAATSLSTKAKDADYSPDFFTSDEFGSVMTNEGVTGALSEFQTEAAKCNPAPGLDEDNGNVDGPQGSVDTVAPTG